MAKDVFDNDQIISQLQNLGDPRMWQGGTVEYAMPNVSPEPNSGRGKAFVAMTDRQLEFAREAFELWDDLIAIDLEEVRNPVAGITLALSDDYGDDGDKANTHVDSLSYTDMDKDVIAEADIWMGTGREGIRPTDTLDYGILAYRSMVHEVGHALGLSHPGNYDDADAGDETYEKDAEYAQDTRQYTIMSYFNAGSDGRGADHSAKIGYGNKMQWASTPLLHDIMAIQALYGADMTTRTGDTTYGFNSNAGRGAFDFNLNEHPVIAIWDAGGTDRLDVSGFSQDQRIDLRAGRFSDVGELTKNVAIAFGAIIEQAIGGAGNDSITGNTARNVLTGNAGNDTLYGGSEADRLYGGRGADTLKGGSGADTLKGGSGADTLNGGTGSDTMAGGSGNDVYYFDTATTLQFPTFARVISFGPPLLPVIPGDRIIEGLNQGSDTVRSYIAFTLAKNLERLELLGRADLAGTGNSFANTLTGNSGDNLLKGLRGNDSLLGMSGNDTIVGGSGRDVMEGHGGSDIFDFNRASESRVGAASRDHIIRFSHADGDRIDLSSIDAITGGFDNAFVFIGARSFARYDASHADVAGMVRAFGGVVQVDIDGNRTVDMEIKVSGVELTASDFIL